MRVAFLGNDPWSVPSLEALAEDPGVEVAAAVTNPPRPAGRGSVPRPTAVAEASVALDIRVAEIEGVRGDEGESLLREMAPDVLVVVAYGELLPAAILDLPPLGAVNVHLSLLPRWRGAAPVQRAILEGDEITGATVMRMDAGLDTGPVLAQRETPIGEDEDGGSLGARLAVLGASILIPTLSALADGTASAQPQDGSRATFAPKLAPGERWIPWSDPPHAIVRRVRALAPRPGARTHFRGTVMLITRARGPGETEIRSPHAVPGSVAFVGNEVTVATPGGAVRLEEVTPAGRAAMPAAAWARGARIRSDERLG